MIFTFVFEKTVKDGFLSRLSKIIPKNNLLLVNLKCQQSINEKRVEDKSRKKYDGKITSVSFYRQLRENKNIFDPTPTKNTLVIDNANLSPSKVATKIAQHFNLLN